MFCDFPNWRGGVRDEKTFRSGAKHIIGPAVQSCGYKAVRADQIDKPGLITSQVIQHVVNDQLVIADLTDRNPNVFYELAIRHALRKPLVQIIKKGESIPFDVAGTRTIYVDHKDLDSVDAAKNEITEQIKALEKYPKEIETPISVSLDLQILRQSEKPEERSLADLLASVGDLRAVIGKIEAKIGTKEQRGLLDEIQAEIRLIPGRLDDYMDSPRMPLVRRKFHPMMIRDLARMSDEENPGYLILVLASFFRDSAPWIYELGIELYRAIRRGNPEDIHGAFVSFRRIVDYTVHGPGQEMFGRSKELFMLMEEIEPLVERVFHMFAIEGRVTGVRPVKVRPRKPVEDKS